MSEQAPASLLGFVKDAWRGLRKHPVITILLGFVKDAWRGLRKHPVITIFTAFLIVAVIVVVILGYLYNWDWTGFTASTSPPPTIVIYQPGKTLWDWLQLLIIPVVLVVGGYIFNLALQRR